MDIKSSHPFSKAFDFASGAIGNRFQNPFWKLTEFVRGSRIRHACLEVRKFGESIVRNAVHGRRIHGEKAIVNDSEKLDVLANSLIDSLLDQIPDRSVVADAAMNYLSAG